MSNAEPTTIAVLGTLAEFHREPIPYNLTALVHLVADIHPDLLCLDMTTDQWQQQDFSTLPPEYQEALLPLAEQTDIVVVPLAGHQHPPKPEASGWRGRVIAWLRSWLALIQRTAPGPDAINQGWRHELANTLYGLTRRLAGETVQKAWDEHADHLTESVLAVARRDPGRRILVVVNVQHCHIIRHRLHHYPELQVTTYQDL